MHKVKLTNRSKNAFSSIKCYAKERNTPSKKN